MKSEDESVSLQDLASRFMKPGAVNVFYPIMLGLLLCANPCWANGMKGNLEKEELDFFDHTVSPILIKAKYCTRVDGDCIGKDFIICASFDSLSCDIYGVADEKVIKEIFMAMLHSGLNVARFTFWRNKHHETSYFEKPLLEFIDRTGSK